MDLSKKKKKTVSVTPQVLPAIVINDDKKMTVVEYDWDGKSDHFAMFVEGFKRMPMVHLRSYKYKLDMQRHAITYVLCDDLISPEQLKEMAGTWGPWLYTYGVRVGERQLISLPS